MANKLLTASGAIAASGANKRVYRVTGGATDVGSVLLKTGGTSGTVVWGGYSAANESVQLKVPGIKADYVTITGTSPYVTVEFSPGTN